MSNSKENTLLGATSEVLEHVFVNLSKRQVTLLDEEGYSQDVNFKFDSEGTEGFSEVVSTLNENLDEDTLTIYD